MGLEIKATKELDLVGDEYLDSKEIKIIIEAGNNCVWLWIDSEEDPIILDKKYLELMLAIIPRTQG